MLPKRERRPLSSEQRCGWRVWEGIICEYPQFALALCCDTHNLATRIPSQDNANWVSPGVMTVMGSGQARGESAWAKATWEEEICAQGIGSHAVR